MRIVPAFDELKYNGTRFSQGAETGAIKQFTFEGGEEAFAQGIVPSTSLRVNSPFADRAHRGADASFPAAATKGQGGVLAAMIGMTLAPPARAGVDDILRMVLLDGHLESSQDQLSTQMSRHGPADDPAAPGIDHNGQVQEPGPGWDVGDTCTARKCRCIRHPEFIRATGSEVTLDQIGRWSKPQPVSGWCGALCVG